MKKKEISEQKLITDVTELLEDYKALIPRYRSVKNDANLLKKFCSRNRNPLWDISNCRTFITGLCSERAYSSEKVVYDHYIQRTKAVKILFDELDFNPNMRPKEFLECLIKYCSVVSLTEEEHKKVTGYCKLKENREIFNYEAYLVFGIKIKGLSDLILKK